MEKIKGYVAQIIAPEEQGRFMPRGWKEPFLKGKYQVIIEREDYPREGFFKKLIFRIKHYKEKYYWVLAFDKVNFAEGDLIGVECEKYFAETDLFINKGK